MMSADGTVSQALIPKYHELYPLLILATFMWIALGLKERWTRHEDDSALLRFLQCKFGKGRLSGPKFFYDPKYALRLCLKEKRMRACVHIYSMMSMHEEAVALALQLLFFFFNCCCLLAFKNFGSKIKRL
ncbi:Vacuolar sorting protein 18 [Camellia lanceoleosa]|uniref:Vacuolar sorting protein 18 n=1 Tax=Camellia lanceoleosa TaxID=1840588 RepID=A0ACC0GUT1_9ERIC|nr:Vacuolar sorting protein 18 [Camellia lanceoleosa]